MATLVRNICFQVRSRAPRSMQTCLTPDAILLAYRIEEMKPYGLLS